MNYREIGSKFEAFYFLHFLFRLKESHKWWVIISYQSWHWLWDAIGLCLRKNSRDGVNNSFKFKSNTNNAHQQSASFVRFQFQQKTGDFNHIRFDILNNKMVLLPMPTMRTTIQNYYASQRKRIEIWNGIDAFDFIQFQLIFRLWLDKTWFVQYSESIWVCYLCGKHSATYHTNEREETEWFFESARQKWKHRSPWAASVVNSMKKSILQSHSTLFYVFSSPFSNSI